MPILQANARTLNKHDHPQCGTTNTFVEKNESILGPLAKALVEIYLKKSARRLFRFSPFPLTRQDLVDDLTGIHSPPHHDSQPLPEALVRILASSAASSLLFHPDFADALDSYADGGAFSEEWRSDESDDYSRLVAEVCSCLLVLRAPKNSGGGEFSSENEANDQHETGRDEALLSNSGKEPSPAAPSWMLLLPASYPRAKERSQLLLAVAEMIDETAEELVCGMQKGPSHPAHKSRHQQGECVDDDCLRQLRDPPSTPCSAWCYDGALQRMTSGLWELACGVSVPIDAIEEEDRVALLYIEKAARLVQEWLRRQWTRRRTRIIRYILFRRSVIYALALAWSVTFQARYKLDIFTFSEESHSSTSKRRVMVNRMLIS